MLANTSDSRIHHQHGLSARLAAHPCNWLPFRSVCRRSMATKIKKSEFAGGGMLVQLLGIGLIVVGCITGPFGLVFFGGCGLLLIIYGGIKANVVLCSDCRGKVEKEAIVCRHCRATFGDDSGASGPEKKKGSSMGYHFR